MDKKDEHIQFSAWDKDGETLFHTNVSMQVNKNKQVQIIKLHKFITSELGEMVMVFQKVLERASLELGFEELRMLSYLLSICDYQNFITTSQKTIAERLSTKQSSVSRAIGNLSSKHYIEVQKKEGRNYYRINPEAAWKGKAVDLKKEIVDINSKKNRRFDK